MANKHKSYCIETFNSFYDSYGQADHLLPEPKLDKNYKQTFGKIRDNSFRFFVTMR
jgi:hypothetical protein